MIDTIDSLAWQLRADHTVAIEDAAQLHAVEDRLARGHLGRPTGIDDEAKEVAYADWAMRKPLYDLFKGENYNNSLLGITLELTEDPLQRLAKAPGLIHGSRAGLNNIRPEQVLGLTMSAGILSTANRDLGVMRRDIWILSYPAKRVQVLNQFWRRCISDDLGDNTLAQTIALSKARSSSHSGQAGHQRRTHPAVIVRESPNSP